MKISDVLDSVNIAEDLDEDQLKKIGRQVCEGFDNDLASRRPWEKDLESWTKLALQIADTKTFPWTGASNIKYPLLATAAMQFAARAYPTLVPANGQIVKCKVVGADPTGEKEARAHRISVHMSHQVMDEMVGWEEDMDKLLISLPIAGTCFKKTYWDSAKQKNCSKLVLPKYLIVNYDTRCLEDAERTTEVVYISQRKVKERMNEGIFLDIDLRDPNGTDPLDYNRVNAAFQLEATDDKTTPYAFLEQHTFLDLDEDGYSEPYIVTVEAASQKVVRIVPRFNPAGVKVNEKGKIISIEPVQYYTKYDFIPNPDGGFYSIGFGRLLGPINEAANTIVNQLTDAGTLSNLQAGFIGKGLRIKMGESKFSPGEWKAVNATGDDIKKQIFPLPVREPSGVLFNLLQLLLTSGKELASVAEIFVGKMPGQNTPATTTMATIEQGMKVFTAVYKRIYRSLAKEFQKLYVLNREYMNPEEYIDVLDEPVQQSDYMGSENDVIPAADPTAVSSQEKQAKVQALMQILQLGTINPQAVTKLYLEAFEIPNAEQMLMQPQPPQPDPKQQEMQAKMQLEQQKAEMQMQLASGKLEIERASKESEAAMKQHLMERELEMKQMEAVLKARAAQAGHQQNMQHTAERHVMDMAKKAQQEKAAPKK